MGERSISVCGLVCREHFAAHPQPGALASHHDEHTSGVEHLSLSRRAAAPLAVKFLDDKFSHEKHGVINCVRSYPRDSRTHL